MKNQLTSLIDLATNDDGFSVIDIPEVSEKCMAIVLRHINHTLGLNLGNLDHASDEIIKNHFDKFQAKSNRMLTKDLSLELESLLRALNVLAPTDFITDEENINYPNIYWRIVRANASSDVGPVHADQWFWDLGSQSIPSSHLRVKTWIPLLQDDANPSLKILPGSQNKDYTYDSITDPWGKRKPVFSNPNIEQTMVTAPVQMGQAIIFNDRLLHGGITTAKPRVSIEWTTACTVPRVS